MDLHDEPVNRAQGPNQTQDRTRARNGGPAAKAGADLAAVRARYRERLAQKAVRRTGNTPPARSASSGLSAPAPAAAAGVRPVQSRSGKTYDISATGILTPIGSTSAAGNLHVVPGISSGPPNGTLNLITGKGTLTLQIPESVAIPSGLPTATSTNEIVDTYVITKGAGAYQGDTGSGVVEFTFKGVNSAGARSQVGRIDITFTTLLASPPAT